VGLIGRHACASKSASPTLDVARASTWAPEHGVETRVVDGVKLTAPAKTVPGCSRFRRHVGLEFALAALKNGLRERKRMCSIETLVEASRAARIDAFLRPSMEVLA
jgi:hypothetical protein